MKSIFDIFEFDTIRQRLATFTKTVRGRDLTLKLGLFKDLDSLKGRTSLHERGAVLSFSTW